MDSLHIDMRITEIVDRYQVAIDAAGDSAIAAIGDMFDAIVNDEGATSGQTLIKSAKEACLGIDGVEKAFAAKSTKLKRQIKALMSEDRVQKAKADVV